MKTTIYLASKSPRRKELLHNVGLTDFVIYQLDVDESNTEACARDTVELLARRKAVASYNSLCENGKIADGERAILISADTVVSKDGRIFGKPGSTEEAFAMLKALSGTSHEVYTGICVTDGEKTVVESERSVVNFRSLSDGEINRYIATGEPMDKAGGYGMQGIAGLFVTGIEGDYFNIVGLPVCRLGEILRRDFGYGIL